MRALALLACLLMAGCQATTFETAPIAAEACDSNLAGRWLSIGDSVDEDGETELRIDADCQLEVIEHENDGPRTGPATTVQVGRHRGHRYAWVEAGWIRERFDAEFDAPASDVHLLRYRIDHDVLHVLGSDDKDLAHRIIDNELRGEVHAADNRLHVRLTGPAQPKLLDTPRLFAGDELRFRRAE
ncbi:MAG TPA: hypothetical protein VFY12_02950 [Arenimonas sp.]|nr:hypothetical protein [Arenimonas sp.]